MLSHGSVVQRRRSGPLCQKARERENTGVRAGIHLVVALIISMASEP